MSPVAAACAAFPPAVALGCTVGVLVGVWWHDKRATSPSQLSEDFLTDEDRDAIAAEFGAHAAAVTAQVEEYADALADGDPLLRARLRELERHFRRKD